MRDALMRFYWRLEKIFYPRLRYSQVHYYETLKRTIPTSCDWLDLGCGHQMFASWMVAEERELARRSRRLVGIDLDWEGMRKNQAVTERVFGDLEKLPFCAGSFDAVTANMVMEHLPNPQKVLDEVQRVLRPGGILIFHTPNVRCFMMTIASKMPQSLKNLLAGVLEGRKEEDVFPTCYRMNRLAVIRRYASKSGFVVQELKSVSTSAITALLGPVAIVELLYLRILESPHLAGFRSNLIAVLRKSA
jgi:ubiquinone/menaquinone biosynthesis C-methylase UbiE